MPFLATHILLPLSPPTWSDIASGIVNSEVWQRTPTNPALDQTFIDAAYSMLNTNDNLTTLSQSDLYYSGGTLIEGTQWMLSIENFSSSYQTVTGLSQTTPELFPINQVKTQASFSSIALKYGPHDPFEVDPYQSNLYNLSRPTTASGTFEAFGGWGLNNLVALMYYMSQSQQNSLLNNFMIYEYEFAQLNDATQVYFSVGGTVSGLSGTLVLQNNGGDNYTDSGYSRFAFNTLIAQGAPYNVTVLTQPTGQSCTVTNGSGIMGEANVSNVAVSCANTPTLSRSASQLPLSVTKQRK